MLALGMKNREVAEKCGVSVNMLRLWRADPAFQAELQALVERHVEYIEDRLLEGELEAVEVLKEALGATKTVKGKAVPDWFVRLQAAMRLLDAQGRRGKPVEKVQQETIHYQGNVEEALVKALRDPVVRAWVEEQNLLPQAVPLSVTDAEYTIEDSGEGSTGS